MRDRGKAGLYVRPTIVILSNEQDVRGRGVQLHNSTDIQAYVMIL